MRRHSFFLKLFVGNLVLVGAILALVGFLSYNSLKEHFTQENNDAQLRTLQLSQRYFEHSWPMSAQEVDRVCKELASSRPRLTVVADDGRVLGDSEGDPAKMDNHKTASRPEIFAALEGRLGRDERRSETLNINYSYLAVPLRHNGQVVAAVRTAMPAYAITESSGFIRGVLWWSALAAVAAAAMLGLLISWIWYSPLRQITTTARSIASGNLGSRARVFGSAELAELATALNEMRQNLAAQIETIASQGQNLQTVVANLREGVLATDAKGNIVLANQAAIDLLMRQCPDPVGRHLHSVVRVLEVVDLYNRAHSAGQPVNRQVEIDIQGQRRYLDVSATPLSGVRGGGIGKLVVMHDITDIARMAAMKAEFVANASHELRTPLATIRAAVDSLAIIDSDDQESFKKCTAILDRHVTRLENMTRDLLDLHLVESGRTRQRIEPISMSSLAAWARTNFADRAAGKGLTFNVTTDNAAADFVTDRILLELILQNLIENAIKFTPPGGTVDFTAVAEGTSLRAGVSDTGCGIPSEACAKVFERFFQIDTARSGEPRVRGTGLGLAIVKHAADRLGGQVDLTSELGKGTTVTVTIPRATPP